MIRKFIFAFEILKVGKVLKKIKYFKITNDGHILFSPIRLNLHHLLLEAFLCNLVAIFGYRCIFLVDDGILLHWDSVHENEIKNRNMRLSANDAKLLSKVKAKITILFFKFIFMHKNVTLVRISQLIRKNEVISSQQYGEIISLYGPEIRASCRRFSGNVEFRSNMESSDYFKKSVVNAFYLHRCAQALNRDFKIIKLVTSHGIYTTWGVLAKKLKAYGISVSIYGLFIYKNRSIFVSNAVEQKLSNDPDWNSFSKRELTTEKKEISEKFLQDRVHYKGGDSHYYYELDKIKERSLSKTESQTVYGLFPNIFWDGDIEEWHANFDSISCWVKETIQNFDFSTNILVLRFHPAEAQFHNKTERLYDILLEEDPQIFDHENLVLIHADENIDLYSFVLNTVDVAIVYDGILALELTYLGIPNISCGSGRYHGAGFSIEPVSKDQYFDLLTDSSMCIALFQSNYEERYDSLLKYTYWYTQEITYECPIVSDQYFYDVDLSNVSVNTFDVKNNASIRRLAERLVFSDEDRGL